MLYESADEPEPELKPEEQLLSRKNPMIMITIIIIGLSFKPPLLGLTGALKFISLSPGRFPGA
jgi:hypothetical protein